MPSGRRPIASRPESVASSARAIAPRDAQTGYLLPVAGGTWRAGGIADAGVLENRRATRFTSPRNPRALFFNESVAVGYIPGAPVIELAAHDPQQGVVFYTLDQPAATPAFVRRTSCLTCHVRQATLNVPG